MNAVQESLDHAEGDEAADVDVGQFAAVLRVPLFDALALFQACVELDDAHAVDYARDVSCVWDVAWCFGCVWYLGAVGCVFGVA